MSSKANSNCIVIYIYIHTSVKSVKKIVYQPVGKVNWSLKDVKVGE